MGIETTKALQARRRESAAYIERLIARADERSPVGSARRARIKNGARFARRQIKSLAAAQQAVRAIEVEIGHALLRLVDQGMSRNDAVELAGLSRHLGRRYIELAQRAQSQVSADLSTAPSTDHCLRPAGGDLDPNGTHAEATTPGRNL